MANFSARNLLFWEFQEGLISYFGETEDLMKWINKIQYIHTMGYYSDIKKEQIPVVLQYR